MLFNLLVILGVWGSQFFLIPNWVNGDEVWVFYFLILVTVGSVFYKPKRNVGCGIIGLILVASLVSVLCHFESPVQFIFVQAFMRVLLGVLAVEVISEHCTISMKQFGEILLWMWIIQHFVMIAQLRGMIFHGNQLSGTYMMPWLMGTCACLSIPFMRKLKPWYSAILVIPLIMSYSSACVVAALFMFIQPRLNWVNITICILLILSYILLFDFSFDTNRFWVIRNSFPYWNNHIIGDGIGSWAHKGFIRLNGNDYYYWRWAHNELYQMMVETGVVGLLATLAFCWMCFRRACVEMRYYFIGILALSMVHPIMHLPRSIPLILLLMAFILRRSNGEEIAH